MSKPISPRPAATVDPSAGPPASLTSCPHFLFSSLAMMVTELVEQALRPLDLRLREYGVLRLLECEGPQSQKRIASALRTDPTTVVSLIDRLEARDFAKRERDTEDRRLYIVSLRPAGRLIVADADRIERETEAAIFAPLVAAERAELRSLAARLLERPGPIAERFAAAVGRTAP